MVSLEMLEIIPFVLGPVGTNAYLVGDSQTHSAVVVDPAWDGDFILAESRRHAWKIEQIWLTHAHFDHIGGIAGLVKRHSTHTQLQSTQRFAFILSPGWAALVCAWIPPEPSVHLKHNQILILGSELLSDAVQDIHQVMCFYCSTEKLLFVVMSFLG
jgi:glyoxylase-like metal-dependent hydrolase (beta-lactamase superfamily II)